MAILDVFVARSKVVVTFVWRQAANIRKTEKNSFPKKESQFSTNMRNTTKNPTFGECDIEGNNCMYRL